MTDENKIIKGIEKVKFIDAKGDFKILCQRTCTCEPPQTLKDIEEGNGFVGITDRYEVEIWNLKEDINEMIYEGDEDEDGEIIDTGEWEPTIEEIYNLSAKYLKTEYHWQDGTVTLSEKVGVE